VGDSPQKEPRLLIMAHLVIPWFCGEYSAKTEALQGKEEIRLPPYPGESLAFRIWMEMIQNGLNKNFTWEGCVFDVFFFLGKFA